MASEKYLKARQLSAKVAKLSDDQRKALADKLISVFNPQGHQLTLHNTILLNMQSGREDLTIVAGFKQWINAGRVVRKGESSLGFIQVPIYKRNGDNEDDSSEKSGKPVYFKLVPVFDVSQTDELVN